MTETLALKGVATVAGNGVAAWLRRHATSRSPQPLPYIGHLRRIARSSYIHGRMAQQDLHSAPSHNPWRDGGLLISRDSSVVHQTSRSKPQSGHDSGLHSHRMHLKGSFGSTHGRSEWGWQSSERSDLRSHGQMLCHWYASQFQSTRATVGRYRVSRPTTTAIERCRV